MIACYVISEWRSHNWHYVLVQNDSKCKHTKIHQIDMKCIVCNKNKSKLMFNPTVEKTFIVYGVGYLTHPLDSSDIPSQKQRMFSTNRLNTGLFLLYNWIVSIFIKCQTIIYLKNSPICYLHNLVLRIIHFTYTMNSMWSTFIGEMPR